MQIMQKFKFRKLQIVFLSLFILILLLAYLFTKNAPQAIDITFYNTLLYEKKIQSATINRNNEVVLQTKEGIYTILKDGIELSTLLYYTPVEIEKDSKSITPYLFIVILIFAFWYLFPKIKNKKFFKFQGKESLDINTSNEEPLSISPIKSNVKFSDVAGIQDAKEELIEIVDFLKKPKKYQKLNINLPRGILLVGPPGVGKTLIAKAVAGEADVPFYYQSGASFVHIYVGMGAKRVRELFSIAKTHTPSIIFIDEIDAVGKARGGLRNDEREATLNQLLTEMDGFVDNNGVLVIGATNKIDIIDEALLRSGRFDRRIFISLPNIEDRVKILETYLKNKIYDVNIKDIARMCVGFNGASLSTLVNEAAINSLKRGSKKIDIDDFIAVRDKVLHGKKKLLTFSDKEKKIQSYYQAAKALSAYWFEINFDKISLIGDFTKELEKEIESKSEIIAKIKVSLSGLAISKLEFNESYSNASEDLKKARELAKMMVEKYGMGERLVPTNEDIENILNTSLREISIFLEGMKKPLSVMSNILLDEEVLTKENIKIILSESF